MSEVELRRLSIAMLGHCDNGKTQLGSLLIFNRDVASLRRQRHKETFDGVSENVFRHTRDERSRGVTMHIHYAQLVTSAFNFAVFDCPGHPDFQKNTVKGMNMAEVAVVVVSALPPEFEVAIGVEVGMARTHIMQAYALGVQHFVFAFTKIDLLKSPESAAARCLEMRDALEKLCKKVGVKKLNQWYVPCSATENWNVSSVPAAHCDLFPKPFRSGPTVLEAIEQAAASAHDFHLAQAIASSANLPLAMTLFSVEKLKGIGCVAIGKVVSGCLQRGDHVDVLPEETRFPVAPQLSEARVFYMERFHRSIDIAVPGDFIGVNIKSLQPNFAHYMRRGWSMYCIRGGLVMTHTPGKSSAGATRPLELIVDRFEAQICLMRVPKCVRAGHRVIVHIGQRQVCCKIASIKDVRRKSKGFASSCSTNGTSQRQNDTNDEGDDDDDTVVKAGDIATAVFVPQFFLAAAPLSRNTPLGRLGRLVFRDGSTTMGVGAIRSMHSPWTSPETVLNVNVSLRCVVPFEVAHIILTFATRYAPVKLSS